LFGLYPLIIPVVTATVDISPLSFVTFSVNPLKSRFQTFGVRVEDSIKTITLENNNFKTNYKYGENLDLSGLTLKVTKESGEISTVVLCLLHNLLHLQLL